MAWYEYEGPDGERAEREYPMSEAPPVGAILVIDGKPFRRLAPRLEGGFIAQKPRHFVSHSLPYNYPYHTGEYDSQGRCLFSSWKEVRECEARANHHGENLVYD